MDFQSTLLGWPGPAVKVEWFVSLSYYRGGKGETKTKTRINPNQEKNTTEPSATNCPGNERLNVGTAHQFFFFPSSSIWLIQFFHEWVWNTYYVLRTILGAEVTDMTS